MGIRVNLDVIMAERSLSGKGLAKAIGITEANLSKLRTDQARAIRFTTLEALCKALDCQPGDLLSYEPDPNAG